jgi:hypothetical protein
MCEAFSRSKTIPLLADTGLVQNWHTKRKAPVGITRTYFCKPSLENWPFEAFGEGVAQASVDGIYI